MLRRVTMPRAVSAVAVVRGHAARTSVAKLNSGLTTSQAWNQVRGHATRAGFAFAPSGVRLNQQQAAPSIPAVDPKHIAIAIETASQPLYELIASGADFEKIAETLLSRAQARADAAASGAEKSDNDTAAATEEAVLKRIVDGGLQIVEAEAMAQIGLGESAIDVVDNALRELATLLPPTSYYIARAKCLKARLLSQHGQFEQATETLQGIVSNDGPAAFADAPSEADGLLLSVFLYSGKAALSPAPEAQGYLDRALKTLDEAEAVASRGLSAKADADGGKILANMAQAVETAKNMRVSILVDNAVAQSTLEQYDAALATLDKAETAVKAVVGGDATASIGDHPALADIDYHRAVAYATMGRVEEGAVKASVARRIVSTHTPAAFAKLCQVTEVECRCLASICEGHLCLATLESVMNHINEVQKDAPERIKAEAGRALRQLAVLRLSVLDDRAQHDEIIQFAKEVQPVLEGMSKEGLLFLRNRSAQATAHSPTATLQDAIDAYTALAKDAVEVVPQHVPGIHMSLSILHLANGNEELALTMRKDVFEKLTPEEQQAHAESDWWFGAATVAMSRGNPTAALALAQRAKDAGMEPVQASFALAPLQFAAGAVAEAHENAVRCLQIAAARDEGATPAGVRLDKSMAELVVISALTRPDLATDAELLAKSKEQAKQAIAVLRADHRLVEAARYEAALAKLGTA